MRRISLLHLLAPILLPLASAANVSADEFPPDLLTRYVDNNTLLVATAQIDSALLAQIPKVIGPAMVTPVDRAMTEKLTPILESWGDRRAFLITGIGDLSPSGPLVIAMANSGEDAVKLNAFADKLREQLLINEKLTFTAEVQVVDGSAVLIGSKATLARYTALKPQPRPELLEPLAEMVAKGTPIAAVAAPGPDARRVLREMWPQLPAPFSVVTGPLLADRVRQITFAAQLPPEWSAEVAIHTTDEETAKTLVETGQQVITQLAPMLQSQPPLRGIDLTQIIETATPKQAGTTVTLDVRHDDAIVAKAIANLAGQAVDDARKHAQRMQRMNQFKQLALAFHNFHDTQKGFPSSATISDKDGKPLLSWRVAILPFLGTDANELFNQFHFDEPWDSEHNLTLVEKMPDVYVDPARPDHGGKTTFLLPVHPETAFPPADETPVAESTLNGRKLFLRPGFSYRDITDGTSQTIMIVEVAPDRAVPWTKPVDWEVDLANPLDGLNQEGRDGFVCAYCDGSAHFNQFSIEPEVLRALLTRAGREVINYSDGKVKVLK